jgi:hypothetical protein
MFRFAIATALLLVAGSIAGGPATSVVGTALGPVPQSRMQAVEDLDDAAPAAVIGAISSQFGERSVRVRLGRIDAAPAGIVQRDLHGTGQLQVGRDPIWIPFRFRALYDTEQASVASPELTLGGELPSHALATDDRITRALRKEVGRRLHQEFAGQATEIRLADVRSAPAGTTFLRIQADGVATFGTDGRAAARIHALYDPRAGEWLQLAYELGADSVGTADTVAVR